MELDSTSLNPGQSFFGDLGRLGQNSAQVELREYQRDCIQNLMKAWKPPKIHKNQLIVMATGLGKTVVFASLLKEIPRKKLILAHRGELIEQAKDKIQWINPEYTVSIEQAENEASLRDDVVVASVPTLGRNEGEDGFCRRLKKFPRDHFELIVIDEAHHATAETYQRILKYFDQAKVLGVTATPKRSDKETLKNVFSNVSYKLDIIEASKKGYLSPILAHRISSNTDLSGIKTTAGDFNLEQLAKRVNNSERNSLILKTYVNAFLGRQCIVYTTDLSHAHILSQEFKNSGLSSEVISGDMNKQYRKECISKFKEGKIQILTNFGVLTEGFDYPKLDLIISARPTQSNLLLTQIMGRGTRLYDGKQRLDFVEIVDLHSNNTATASEIFGFRQTFDPEGHDFTECMREADRIEESFPETAPYYATTYTRMIGSASVAEARKEEFSKEKDEGLIRDQFGLRKRYRWYQGSSNKLRFKHKDRDSKEEFLAIVEETALGNYQWSIKHKLTNEIISEGFDNTRIEGVTKLESWVSENRKNWDRLLNLDAQWRKRAMEQPCSDKQWYWIQKMRLTNKERSEVSKNIAGELLSQFFNKK